MVLILIFSLSGCNNSDPQSIALRDIETLQSVLIDKEVFDVIWVMVNGNTSYICFKMYDDNYEKIGIENHDIAKTASVVIGNNVYFGSDLYTNVDYNLKNVYVSREKITEIKQQIDSDMIDGTSKWKDIDLTNTIWE